MRSLVCCAPLRTLIVIQMQRNFPSRCPPSLVRSHFGRPEAEFRPFDSRLQPALRACALEDPHGRPEAFPVAGALFTSRRMLRGKFGPRLPSSRFLPRFPSPDEEIRLLAPRLRGRHRRHAISGRLLRSARRAESRGNSSVFFFLIYASYRTFLCFR